MAGCHHPSFATGDSADRISDRRAPYRRHRRPMGKLVAGGLGDGEACVGRFILRGAALSTSLPLVLSSSVVVRLHRLDPLFEASPYIYFTSQHLLPLARGQRGNAETHKHGDGRKLWGKEH